LPDGLKQAAGESRRQAESQAIEIKTQAKAGALIETPSQRTTSQRELVSRKTGGASGEGRRREPEGRPQVIRRCNGRWMRDTHRRLSRRCKVPLEAESSPQACERDSVAQAAEFKPQAQRTSNRRDSGSRDSRVRELGSGASRKCGSQPRAGNWSPALPKDEISGVSRRLNRRRCH